MAACQIQISAIRLTFSLGSKDKDKDKDKDEDKDKDCVCFCSFLNEEKKAFCAPLLHFPSRFFSPYRQAVSVRLGTTEGRNTVRIYADRQTD